MTNMNIEWLLSLINERMRGMNINMDIFDSLLCDDLSVSVFEYKYPQQLTLWSPATPTSTSQLSAF